MTTITTDSAELKKIIISTVSELLDQKLEQKLKGLATKDQLSRLATKGDIALLATKGDITLLATKKDLDKTNEKITHLPTKAQFYAKMDKWMVAASTKELEGSAHKKRHDRAEKRLDKIESHLGIVSI